MSDPYPIGTVLAYAGTVSDTQALSDLGWLLCDGSAYSNSSKAPYYALFQVIGTSYGANTSNQTFCVPNYTGQFLRGVDGGRGLDPDSSARAAANPSQPIQGNAGDNVGSLQASAFASHVHSYGYQGGNHQIQADSFGDTCIDHGPQTVSTNAYGSSTETRPVNIYVNYLIKYRQVEQTSAAD